MGDRELLRRTAELAEAFLDGLDDRPVGRPVDLAALRAALDGPMPAAGEEPLAVIEGLARAADPGLVATAGPRYFGFVIGGSQPAALAADWLTSAWDQNAGLYVALAGRRGRRGGRRRAGSWSCSDCRRGRRAGSRPGRRWPTSPRSPPPVDAVLRALGWDVEERGLFDAPAINVVVGDEAHVTIFVSLQMLGLGRGRVHRVAADGQGRMRADALRATLAGLEGPTIVVAQAGNVNTGAFDPLPEIAAAVREHGGWLHVDGAFGLWAAASPALRDRIAGLELADSWTTDAHKWLNVPYDSGLVFVRDVAAHRTSMTLGAAYYVETEGAERDPYNWVAESSRRARGFTVYAALRSLGRDGLAELVDRCCGHARRFAERLAERPGVTILNDVVLNQVLVRFAPPGDGASDEAAIGAFTRDVIARVQADGTCWLGGTTWHGMAAMRISVSSWATTEADVDLSVDAILRCASDAAEAHPRATPV